MEIIQERLEREVLDMTVIKRAFSAVQALMTDATIKSDPCPPFGYA